jgi:hypothetical protein
VASTSLDEPITPNPHTEFCRLLLEGHNLLWREFVATDQITTSELEQTHRLYIWSCEHVRTPYKFTASERGSFEPDYVRGADLRTTILQFIYHATPHRAFRAGIMINHKQIRKTMRSRPEAHCLGDEYTTVVKMVDNVPDTVSPSRQSPSISRSLMATRPSLSGLGMWVP